MSKNDILKRIQHQESIEGQTEDIKILKHFLNCIKFTSQWNAFTNIKWIKTEKYSYQGYRFYYPTDELKKIYSHN